MPRGRHAETPRDIPAKGWKDIAMRIKDEIDRDNVGLVAAGIAFYGLLSLFPLVTALVALSGAVAEPSQIAAQIRSLAGTIPEDVANIVIDQVQEVAGSSQGTLGFTALLGILFAVYSASKGVDNMIRGLNIAYDETEKRGFVQLKLTVLALTVALVVGLLLTVAVMAALPAAVAILGDSAAWTDTAQLIRWPLLLAIGTTGITLLYRYGPSRDPAQWRWLTPGAAVACLLWAVGSFAFTWYVQNFGSYNETFGALGGVIILLMWLWISAYIVLLGAEIDSEMEAQTRRDTTTGTPKPMGQRNAVKADRLGAAAD